MRKPTLPRIFPAWRSGYWKSAHGHVLRVGPVAVFTRHRKLEAVRLWSWEIDSRGIRRYRWLR